MPEDYQKDGRKLKLEIEKSLADAEEQFQAIVRSMTVRDHLNLIESILRDHVGARLIRIIYSVPISDENIKQRIVKILYQNRWNVNMVTDGSIIIHNYNEHESRLFPQVFIKPQDESSDRSKILKRYVRIEFNDPYVEPSYIGTKFEL
jgi:hypothetical protein